MSLGKIKINVFQMIGGDSAIAVEDGQALFDQIKKALEKDFLVEVDFANVTLIVSSFLNAAIGQLYGEFDEAKIKENVTVTGLSEDDVNLLTLVITRAKEYFSTQEAFSKIVKSSIGDDN